jgi:prophage regulatory protein
MKLIRYDELSAEKGIPYSREHLRRLELEGRFPKKVKLGDSPNSLCGWYEHEVEAWLASRREPAAA